MTDNNLSSYLDEAIRAGKAVLLAKGKFHLAWINYWRIGIAPCTETVFFRLLSIFRSILHQFVFDYNRGSLGVIQSSEELFRQVCTGEATWSWDEATGFARYYQSLRRQIAAAIGHLFDFHGDSFSDLCDSLPLAGEEIIKRCLDSHSRCNRLRRNGFLDENELNEAIKGLGPFWGKFILVGENYLANRLEDACKKYWLYELMVDSDGKHHWTEEEQDLLSFADRGVV